MKNCNWLELKELNSVSSRGLRNLGERCEVSHDRAVHRMSGRRGGPVNGEMVEVGENKINPIKSTVAPIWTKLARHDQLWGVKVFVKFRGI